MSCQYSVSQKTSEAVISFQERNINNQKTGQNISCKFNTVRQGNWIHFDNGRVIPGRLPYNENEGAYCTFQKEQV